MANLKAAIALLPDAQLANRLSALALSAHGATGGRLRWPRLAPHLSFEQPFAFESLPLLQRQFDQLAGELAPISATLGAIELRASSQNGPEATVWVGVHDCPALLALQQRIELELGEASAKKSAPHAGDPARFHITIGFLPTSSLAPGTQLPDLEGSLATFGELGLFMYDGLPGAGWQCMLYARRSLGAAPRAPSTEA
jgi:2'-5' RNA ligase